MNVLRVGNSCDDSLKSKTLLCRFCRRTRAEVNAHRRATGKRLRCDARPTKSGFHIYVYV